MPAPYVVIGTVVVGFVAVYALKHFVYDPHVAPKVDDYLERRRQRQRGPVAVPASAESGEDEDEDKPLVSDDDHGYDGGSMSIELRDLRARETAEWRSTNPTSMLRQRGRHIRSSDVLDESNVFLPYDPISPMLPSVTESSAPSSPFVPKFGTSQAPTPSVIHSPSPRTAVDTSRLRSSVTVESVSSSLAALDAFTSSRVSSPASSTRSESTASSFTPAVLGPASRAPSDGNGTPQIEGSLLFEAARSPTLDGSSSTQSRVHSPFVAVAGIASAETSPTRSNTSAASPRSERAISPLSPFSDIQALDSPDFRSPSPVFLSPQPSSLHLGAWSETAVLSPSLRSGIFSPSMSSVDDQFDITSFAGSDFDDWNSVGRRTPSPGTP